MGATEITKDGHCFAGGVFGNDGATWAVEGITASTHDIEVPNLESGGNTTQQINENAEIAQASMNTTALWINGEKWQVVSTNEVSNTLYLVHQNKGGALALCNQCKLVGFYDTTQGQSKGKCNEAVENLAQKLKDAGY